MTCDVGSCPYFPLLELKCGRSVDETARVMKNSAN